MWKTLAGKRIYKTANGVQVFQNLLFRWLKFDSNALQTLLNRYFPHRPGLYYIKSLILAVQTQPANCCMFGLGGGGAAHAIAPYLEDFQLTIVEGNPEVIDIAHRFFMLNRLKNINIINQDANLFVQLCEMQFPHLLVDLFNAETFPSHCNTEQFFSQCKRILSPEGVLAVNLANRHEQWPIFQLIRKNFLQCTVALPVKKSANMIILASKSDSVTPLLDILKKSKKLKRLSWDSLWGCIAEIN